MRRVALVLVVCVLVSTAHTQDSERGAYNLHGCSRDTSGRVREAVARHIVEPMQRRFPGYTLPPGCPLSGSHNIYEAHELAKQRISEGVWNCTVCGKQFTAAHWLDLHAARRHAGLLDPTATQCLADHCATFGVCAREEKSQLKTVHDPDHAPERGCDAAILASRRRACALLASRCLEPGMDAHHTEGAALGHALASHMTSSLCARLTCDGAAPLSTPLLDTGFAWGTWDAGMREHGIPDAHVVTADREWTLQSVLLWLGILLVGGVFAGLAFVLMISRSDAQTRPDIPSRSAQARAEVVVQSSASPLDRVLRRRKRRDPLLN